MPSYFILTSTEPDSDTTTFWNAETNTWTLEEDKATRFDNRCLSSASPENTGFIIECDSQGNYLDCFAPFFNE